MIVVRSASIAFGDHVLFSDLDLEVGRGQFVGLAGESGCGKTSLLRAVLGFVPLAAGTIEVCGLPLDVHHVAAIRRQVAYVPQELQPPAATGADLVRLTHQLEHNRSLLSISPSAASSSAASPVSSGEVPPSSSFATVPSPLDEGTSALSPSLLKSLSLSPDLLSLAASKLSGGQRQRLLLAAALSLPKPLLLLDEPTSALDEESTQRVSLTLLRACHEEGRAVLAVSHNQALLALCDKVVTLT